MEELMDQRDFALIIAITMIGILLIIIIIMILCRCRHHSISTRKDAMENKTTVENKYGDGLTWRLEHAGISINKLSLNATQYAWMKNELDSLRSIPDVTMFSSPLWYDLKRDYNKTCHRLNAVG